MKKINTNQSGRSMIEMLGVLAVIGVLTVGGFSLVSKVTTAHKSNVTIDEIGTLANKARTVFHEYVLDKKEGDALNFSTFNAYLANAKAFPASVEANDDGFLSQNDIQYDLQHITSSKDVDYFYIKISQLDNEMCMTVSQSTWGSPSLNGYVGICVGSDCGDKGGVVDNSNPGSNVAKGGAKISLDGATESCTAGTNNVVYLTFR
ncbi:MAG: hypothetical protein IKR92_05595 [Alphaproteobacteria bacterium]|nr:hypothetical protein [Alphaproteobacteria bacterium]